MSTIQPLPHLQKSGLSYLLSDINSLMTQATKTRSDYRQAIKLTEHDKDAARKRDQRSENARVYIPPVLNPDRRENCLADPVLFLRTYFAPIFYNPFADHHLAMIDAIVERAWTGGDKAIAAPRGDGKTQCVIGAVIYVLLATPISYPVFIAATTKKARKLFSQFKSKFSNEQKYPEFCGDFPEITACVKALDGAPQRAAKQHVDGVPTNIIWSQDRVRLPFVHGSPYGGKSIVYFGLDSAIRGEGDEERRPDLAIIDDPETREVAFSPTNKHEDIEEMIDSDVAGLAGPDKQIPRCVLTTIQNRNCYSFRVTDKTQRPGFAGSRYAQLKKWPDNRELWDEYLALRQKDQADGDKDGKSARQFYLDNIEAMQAGAELGNPHRFVSATNESGEPIEIDALQAFFNRVADWGIDRVRAELQQDPAELEEVDSLKLSAGTVASRMSGLPRGKLPDVDDRKILIGLDLGKYYSHWTKVVLYGNATGHVVDYGVMETPGLKADSDVQAVEAALLQSLENWRTEQLAEGSPDLVFIDSGTFTTAVYEFIRRFGSPFVAAKGQGGGRVHMTGDNTATRLHFEACRADLQVQERLWLYHFDSEYWKQQVQQRFLTSPRNAADQRNDGSLTVWSTDDRKEHLSYSHHIVSEERREIFKPGKGLVKTWTVVNKNNHWLDATAMALAAGGVLGVRILPNQPIQTSSYKPTPQQPKDPNRFRQRQGGWIKGMKR